QRAPVVQAPSFTEAIGPVETGRASGCLVGSDGAGCDGEGAAANVKPTPQPTSARKTVIIVCTEAAGSAEAVTRPAARGPVVGDHAVSIVQGPVGAVRPAPAC